MYPYPLITFSDGSHVSLYEIFIVIGVIAAIVLFRILADRRKLPAKLQNLVLIGAVVSFVVGYFFAVFFQALYDIAERGAFIIDKNTGATFYGGFIGGAACMLLIYFVGGHFLFKKQNGAHLRWFWTFVNIAAACVPLAHGFGRIGCLCGGCCYGMETDAWYGIPMDIGAMDGVYVKVIPTQLFEAIFLFALAGYLIYRNWKGKGFCLPIYLISYGVWRFLIEYLRADDRGQTFIPFLSPSQLTALFLVIVGAGLIAGYFAIVRKKGKEFFAPPGAENNAAHTEESDAAEGMSTAEKSDAADSDGSAPDKGAPED